MRTHAELAAKLLREAAAMFRSLGAPDPELGERLDEFASVYERVAELVEQDPNGLLELAQREGSPRGCGAASTGVRHEAERVQRKAT